ncbi:MAG: hypothetical protein Q9174_000633 [Haloplaca sp. 1 TL-2023]
MAPNGIAPVTSMDIVRQQQYCQAPQPGFKRSFQQAIAAESHSAPGATTSGVSTCKEGCAQLSGGSRPLVLLRDRLPASKICNSSNAYKEEADVAATHVLDIASIPSSSLNPLLSLSHPKYGLPESLVTNLATMGIRYIYPWQSSCLLGRGLLSGEKNLVYTAPTGGGKSLVADVLMLKKVLSGENFKAILVLPYVALVQEKISWLRKAIDGVKRDSLLPSQVPKPRHSKWLEDQSIRVVGFFGGSKTRATWSNVDIAVCTFEKAWDKNR